MFKGRRYVTNQGPQGLQLSGYAKRSEIVELLDLYLAEFIGYDAIDCSGSPNYPAADAGQQWIVSVAGFIGGGAGPAVEVGDVIICITDSIGGTHAVVGAFYVIVQKNMIPCTYLVLRTGTDNSAFTTAKTFNDQGLLFDANYNLGLTKSIIADDITTSNLVTYRGITGVLNGDNATLSTKNIYSTTDITLANTANETALYAGDCGLGYWSGQMQFTHNGAGAIALDYWPDAFRLVMGSTPIDGGGGGTIAMDSWIWGVFLDSYVGGAASLSTIHNDSWNFQSAFTTVQTANSGAGDWTGFFSDINGINDPLVSAYGFRSVLHNTLDGATIAGFYSDIDVETASINNNALFRGYFHGSRDAGTNPIDAGLWVEFGIAGYTFTLDEADALTYGVKVIGNTGKFVHTNGAWHGVYVYNDTAVAAGTSVGIETYMNTVNANNVKQLVYAEKTLIGAITADRTISGNATTFRVDSTNTSADDFDMNTTGNVMVLGLTHTANTTTGAKTHADTCSARGIHMPIYATTTNAIDKLTMSSSAILVDYNITETLGTLTLAAHSIVGIEYNTSGTPDYAAGVYNLFSATVTEASVPTYGATTYFSAYKADLSDMIVSDANLTLYGINIVMPAAYGASTEYAAYFAGDSRTLGLLTDTAHIYSAETIITDMPVTAPGVGFDTAGGVLYIPHGKKGASGMILQEIFVDLNAAAVSGVGTDGDAIGEAAGGTAFIGQITAALNGTVQAIEVICVEAPTTGTPDINLYSNASGALVYGDALGGGTLLVDAAGAWTLGMVKAAANLPAADHYLYLGEGDAAGAGAYATGKFIIRIYGS